MLRHINWYTATDVLENRSSCSVFRVKHYKNRGENTVAHIPSVSIKGSVETLHGICKRVGHFYHPTVLQPNTTTQSQQLGLENVKAGIPSRYHSAIWLDSRVTRQRYLNKLQVYQTILLKITCRIRC